MPATPKKIAFDDIREGDTIRVVDVRDVKIAKAGMGSEVRAEGGSAIMRGSDWTQTKRTFQLLDRAHTPLPTKRGSVIEIDSERFVLVYDTYAPTDLWVSSATGEKLDPPRIQRIVDTADDFEVIA